MLKDLPSDGREESGRALAESPAFTALLAESSADFIGLCDMGFIPVFVNQAGLRLIGLESLEEAKRVEVRDFFFPEDQAFILDEFFPRVLREGQGEVEVRFRNFKTGDALWMIYRVHLLRQDGAAVGLATVSRNITERRRAEEALRLSRYRLDMVVDSIQLGLWYCDLPSRDLVWNSTHRQHLGVAPDVAPHPDRFFEVLHPDDVERTREAVERSINEAADFDAEYRTLGRDGRVRWIRAIGRTFHDPRGFPSRFDGVTVDVTRQKESEQHLRETETRFRRMADSAPAILWVTDSAMQCIYLSRRWYEYTGSTPERDLGFGWLDHVHPDDLPMARELVLDACERRVAFTLDYRLRRHDGEYRWAVDAGLPRFDEHGVFLGHVGSVIDVHERKLLEQALQEANRAKDEFLATLAHELRNPLAPLRNALQILRLAGGDEALAERTRALMERQVTQMVRLIDDLLDVSRITRGKLELCRERVDLATVLHAAVETSRPLIEAARHELSLSLPAEPVPLDADPTRLAQAFSNLLNNAAKYTLPGGRIGLATERQGDHVLVTVRDTGIGIPADRLPHIFEMFTQLDRSLERTQGGLGIGLTLARRLVEMHGGTIEARSGGPGQGSELLVRLPVPVPAVAAPTPDAGGPAAAVRQRILVADDNRDAADSLGMMLEILGAEVRVVYDGLAAVAAAAEMRPDVVLLDIGMPGLNGYDAARRIREAERGYPVTLIALTGWGQEEDKRRSREAGFDHHLVKPVSFDLLTQLLAGQGAAREA